MIYTIALLYFFSKNFFQLKPYERLMIDVELLLGRKISYILHAFDFFKRHTKDDSEA